jgi:hypothetical protein
MSEWVSIADAKEIYGKSETTMRNLVRKLKASRSKDLKIDKSANGREIIRFKRVYLDKLYKTSTDSQGDGKTKENNDSDIVAFLKQQIEIKDRQIEQMGFLLAQSQDEKKQLLLISEKPKKRRFLFWRKKE